MTPEETRNYNRKWRASHKENIQRYGHSNKEKRKAWDKKWRESHHEEYRKWVGEWRVNNRERSLEIDERASLKKRYGITPEYYNRMLEEQGGCCEICGKVESYYKRKLAVDHDHSTGSIRGLLCVKCNSGIGCFEDNTALLDNAKVYLTKYAGLEKVKDFC